MREAESPSNASVDLASFLTALANRIEAVNPALLRQADDVLLDTLGCIEGADRGDLKIGFCLGGNLFGSNPRYTTSEVLLTIKYSLSKVSQS